MKDFQIRSFLPKAMARYTIPKPRQWSCPSMEIYTAFVAAISFFCSGVVQSYTSPAIYSLESDGDSNITLTRADISWIASSPSLAAFFGTILAAPLLQYCGRQKTLLFLTLPYITGWLLIGFTSNIAMLHAGRAFSGLGIGLTKATAPIYVSECARASVRGMLGFLPPMMNGLGILVGLFVGCWIDWRSLALILTVFPVLLLLLSLWLPESPLWLLLHDQGEKAFKSLQRLRGGGKGRDLRTQEELDEMRVSMEEMNSSGLKLKWKDCIRRKEIWMAFSLMIFQQFCGVSAVIYYLSMILTETSTRTKRNNVSYSVNPETAALSLGVVHFVAFFISLPLIDRIGRRLLLIVSGVLMALAHLTLAVFLFLISNGENEQVKCTGAWLPISTLCAFIAAFSIGFGPVPYVFMTEVFPSNSRAYLCSAAALLSQLASFTVLQSFPLLIHLLSPYLVFLIYALVCILAVLFVIFIVPETKGKTLGEIEKFFRGPQTLLEREVEGSFKNSYESINIPCVYVQISTPIEKIAKASQAYFPFFYSSPPYKSCTTTAICLKSPLT